MTGIGETFLCTGADLGLTEAPVKHRARILRGIIEVKLVAIPYIYYVNDDFMPFVELEPAYYRLEKYFQFT